jgi:ankyrin repeat protein
VSVKRLAIQSVICLLAIIGAAAAADLRLIRAAERQDRETIRRLIKERVDVNATEEDGTTALAWAVHWNNAEMAQLLIEAGANVNAATDLGVTPLSLACTNGSVAMIERLLKAGANPNASRSTGETPLMTCARAGTVPGVRALLTRGANLDATQARGQTALMWAITERHADVIRALIEAGADVHARSANGFTAILFAGQQGSLEAGQLLVAAGANVNDKAPDGSTPLLLAVSGTHPVGDANVSLVRRDELPLFLLSRGADPNLADADGYTPLHWAAQNGKAELVKALLKAGARPNVRVSKDPPPPSGSFTYTTKGLAGATPFWLATRAGHLEVMRALGAAGADASLGTTEGSTPLALVMPSGGGRGGRGGRGMGSAAAINLEAVRAVIDAYPDVNAVNANGQTALHAAVNAGANDVVEMLMKKGARIDVKDMKGDTPMAIAERRPDKSTAELLLELTR